MTKPQKKSGEIRQFVLENVEDHPADITSTVAEHFSISRQAAHKHVQKLVAEGALMAHGATRDRTYEIKLLVDFALQLPLIGLEEDKVWREHIRPRMENLPPNVLGICQYGFTEMVNNAIEHSEGTELSIMVRRSHKLVRLIVLDNGIGIFAKLQEAFHLDDPLHVILELSKGKLTSDPARHTGEGIFFTSHMVDQFFILSGKLSFGHFETKGDFLIEDKKDATIGTGIVMVIASKSERTTQKVFDAYTTGDDLGFSKTQVPVFLATYGDENLISRSQAKRLLARFEKFREISLDFANVNSIGPAFADEIFRVFVSQHPEIHITPKNTNNQIEKMIARATSEF